MNNLPAITVQGGRKLPILAFGNGTANYGRDTSVMVEHAVKAGFTLIDTAELYSNSQHVGPVLSRLQTDQKPIQVIAKIQSMNSIRDVALAERTKLGVETLDVLLLHSPPRAVDGKPSNVEAWEQVQKLKEDGIADIIGVSNWLASDIEEVMANNPKFPIQINQSEYHPYLAGSDKMDKLLDVEKKYKICTMIYGALTPITSGPKSSLHPILESIAAKETAWTPATVLFKWASQVTAYDERNAETDGIIVTTGSKQDRLAGYLGTFLPESRRLSNDEVTEISTAGRAAGVHKVRMAKYFNARVV